MMINELVAMMVSREVLDEVRDLLTGENTLFHVEVDMEGGYIVNLGECTQEQQDTILAALKADSFVSPEEYSAAFSAKFLHLYD